MDLYYPVIQWVKWDVEAFSSAGTPGAYARLPIGAAVLAGRCRDLHEDHTEAERILPQAAKGITLGRKGLAVPPGATARRCGKNDFSLWKQYW